MNKLKRKISALLLAFAMVLGVVAPSVAMAAEGTTTGKTKVVIHKMLVDDVSQWKDKIVNSDGTWSGVTPEQGEALKYDGSEINDITGFSEITLHT